MAEFLQQLINGLSLGAIYALIALGYTMVYGVLRFINFAHSDVFMVGAFGGYYLAKVFPIPSLAARVAGLDRAQDSSQRISLLIQWFACGIGTLLASMILCAALGILIERLAYKPLRARSKLTVLITAIGVSLLLENAGQFIFGANPKRFPLLFPEANLHFGGIVLSSIQVIVFVVTIVLLAALEFIVQRTKIGTAMRAVSFNPQAAALVGINNDVIISFTFGLGSALAAAGGILYSLSYPTIDPLMGILPGLKAFVAAVLGGIGNIPGAALGGLVLGVIETFVNGSRFSTYTDAILFSILILMLLFRPAGLLGRLQVEKVQMAYRSHIFLGAAILASLGISLLSPHLNSYYLDVAISVGVNIILAVSLNLINGYTGQFSLGHAGFMAVGAYTTAAVTMFLGPRWFGGPSPWLFLPGLLAGGTVAALAGLVVGVPSLRLKGDYLAIVTLGFGEIIRVLFRNTDQSARTIKGWIAEPGGWVGLKGWLKESGWAKAILDDMEKLGGALGLTGIPPYANFFWTFAFAALTVYIVTSLVNSTYGRSFIATHDDEVAASAMGVNTTKFKIIAFVVGAFFAGVAGGIFGHFKQSIDPKGFDFIKSIEIVVIVILGGMGNTLGVILAAILLTVLLEKLRDFGDYRMMLYSLLIIVIMLARPQGLFTWPKRRREGAPEP